MDDLRLSDPRAQQLGRFFVDLMLTLAEDDFVGADSAEAIGSLWRSSSEQVARDLDTETLVHGLGGVAAALAGQLAAERGAAGRCTASVAEVWQELARALDPHPVRREEAGSGGLDPT